MTREPIYAALFARGTQAAGFIQPSRRLRHIDDLQPAEFPAFYQVQLDEDWKQKSSNLPAVGDLQVEWWVYVQSGDPTVALSSLMNPLVDALLASVGLPGGNRMAGAQTLGGLVDSVRLDGKIQYAEGVLDDRAFVRIPLLINLPNT